MSLVNSAKRLQFDVRKYLNFMLDHLLAGETVTQNCSPTSGNRNTPTQFAPTAKKKAATDPTEKS